ncbi:MAG TPA: PEGA domain-containing protein [Methanospirillum sp.]|uniref:PEGA domain-containing protein n=1 Tax=Methanospirillum sp. TaxID=45200 RepID=UPI002C1D55BC|nr:PEGA domain-containing protein [Methanospirillum sp.]HWQ62851.1 PEGA domain-containing protein [Methanospirillum sp.]
MKNPRLMVLLFITLLLLLLPAGAMGSVRVDADLPGVAIFVDGSYIGTTPQNLSDVQAGEHQIAATVTGHQAQSRNLTFPLNGSDQIIFTFGSSTQKYVPGMIRIRDCVGTPEMTGLLGSSITVATLPDGNLMAYYSGIGEGVRCAGSADGSQWHEFPDGCLLPSDESNASSPFSSPWVFATSDGGYRMIYGINDENGPSLYSARSKDGFRFTPEGKVKLSQVPDQDMKGQYSIPSGLRMVDGKLRMYYAVSEGAIRSAVSGDDGKTWMSDEGYRLESATDPTVALLENGTYGLFYVDLSAGAKGQRLMLATSSDGLIFSHSINEPILESEQKGVWILDPEIHKSSSGTWNLYYSLMGVPGEAGIKVPVIMRSVIDPDCLLSNKTR